MLMFVVVGLIVKVPQKVNLIHQVTNIFLGWMMLNEKLML